MVKGKYIIIYSRDADEPLVAGVTADRLRVAGETIEIASATSSQWKEFITGRKEWGIDTDYLITTDENIHDYPLRVGQTFNIRVQDSPRYGTDSYCIGTVICTECVVDFRQGSLVKGTFSFQGTGPLAGV